MHNNASSSKRVLPLLSSHIKIHRHICLELFSLVNMHLFVHISLLIQTKWFFHCWKHYYGLLETRVEVKNVLMDLLTDRLEWWIICGLLRCFYQLFGLSSWRHPFTAEHPLVSKCCDAKFFNSVLMKKQTHLHLGWPEGEYIFSKALFLGELFL